MNNGTLKELRKLDKINHAKANYVRQLQNRGKLSKYTVDGYAAFCTKELKMYSKNVKIGRPLKETKINKEN